LEISFTFCPVKLGPESFYFILSTIAGSHHDQLFSFELGVLQTFVSGLTDLPGLSLLHRWDGVSWTFCLCWLETLIIPISASQIAVLQDWATSAWLHVLFLFIWYTEGSSLLKNHMILNV
jgi:hypothetical protein